MRLERWFNKSSSWLRLLLHRREADEALDEEIQFHLDAKTEQYVEKGMTPVAARRAACIVFYGPSRLTASGFTKATSTHRTSPKARGPEAWIRM